MTSRQRVSAVSSVLLSLADSALLLARARREGEEGVGVVHGCVGGREGDWRQTEGKKSVKQVTESGTKKNNLRQH